MTDPTPLMAFVVTILSSILSPTITDQNLARQAARQAIDAHRIGNDGELLTVARAVGFALTALDTLRLSMPEDLSLTMKLRLRGNANALNRSARANTSIREKTQRTAASPNPQPEPKVEWGAAMKTVAEQLQSNAATASPAQRQSDALWIEALTGVAGELARAKPQTNKAGLLTSTLMASDLYTEGKRKRA